MSTTEFLPPFGKRPHLYFENAQALLLVNFPQKCRAMDYIFTVVKLPAFSKEMMAQAWPTVPFGFCEKN